MRLPIIRLLGAALVLPVFVGCYGLNDASELADAAVINSGGHFRKIPATLVTQVTPVVSTPPIPSGPLATEADRCTRREPLSGHLVEPSVEAGASCDEHSECGPGAYCEIQWGGTCDVNRGACTALPQQCNDTVEPVCGCDGVLYSNACEAARAGVNQNTEGTCEVPQGRFACGAGFCVLGEEYCSYTVSHSHGTLYGHGCSCTPKVCRELETVEDTCACLDRPSWCGCEGSADGGVAVVCGDL